MVGEWEGYTTCLVRLGSCARSMFEVDWWIEFRDVSWRWRPEDGANLGFV